MTGLVVDNFAGGGGASTGIEAALGRAVDVAINHDEEAIRMHEANHPATLHIRNNIWQVDPIEAVRAAAERARAAGRDVPVDSGTGLPVVELAWFSPDCKHFSKAKGGKPREKSIRDLAWVVPLWGKRVRPLLILLENVEEFRTWGPLDDAGQPIKERAGEEFSRWCTELRRLGYRLQFRELRACDYGAPTIRKRFLMIARRDGLPITWPEPTHGAPDSPDVLSGKRLPWRTAAEIIDWSIPCPSIFERKKPLAEKTLKRVAHGTVKFVLKNPKPFIVRVAHGDDGRHRCHSVDEPLGAQLASKDFAVVCPHVTKFREGAVGHKIDDPLATVTANSFIKRPGGCAPLGLVAGTMVQMGYGEREGQEMRALDVEAPLGTVVAGGVKHAAVAAFLLHQYGSATNGGQGDPDHPLKTVTTGGHHAIVAAHIEQANGSPDGEKPLAGRAADAPLSTIVAKGCTQRLIETTLVGPDALPPELLGRAVETAAFLIKYYGNESDGHGLDAPIGTVTVNDRFAVVTVLIDAETYILVDIGMRMLTPRELFNAQGFPPDYIIDHDAEGRPTTKTSQVARCGNSVCPPLAEALTDANAPSLVLARREVPAEVAA